MTSEIIDQWFVSKAHPQNFGGLVSHHDVKFGRFTSQVAEAGDCSSSLSKASIHSAPPGPDLEHHMLNEEE